MERIPCRVNAELRQHHADAHAADIARDTPNFADEEDLHDLVRAELREPLAQLFTSRDQLKRLETLSDRLRVQVLMKDLDELERALRALWEAA